MSTFAIKYDGRDLFLMSTTPLPAFTEKPEEALTFATKDEAVRVYMRLPVICGSSCDVVELAALPPTEATHG